MDVAVAVVGKLALETVAVAVADVAPPDATPTNEMKEIPNITKPRIRKTDPVSLCMSRFTVPQGTSRSS